MRNLKEITKGKVKNIKTNSLSVNFIMAAIQKKFFVEMNENLQACFVNYGSTNNLSYVACRGCEK